MTCVLCNSCWEHDKHIGHEIFFYHSNTGGCCDCGDVDAWDKNGFCVKHTVKSDRYEDPLSQVPRDILDVTVPLMTDIIRSIVSFAHEYKATYSVGNAPTGVWRVLIHQNGIYNSQKVAGIIGHLLNAECALQYEKSMLSNKSYALVDVTNDIDCEEDMNGLIEELRARNLKVNIPSDEIISKEVEIVKILQWLYSMSQLSDAHCRIICNTLKASDDLDMQDSNFLIELLRLEPYLSGPVTENLHELLLTLMADQSFKMILAVAYATSYTYLSLVNQELSQKCPLFESGLFHLSVQFLNREVFVAEIVENHKFLQSLCVSLLTILDINPSASSFDRSITTEIIKHRRYNYVLNDIKIILTIPRMAQCFIDDSECLHMFLSILNGYQYSDRIKREMLRHVDYESSDWQHSFGLFLAVASIFEPLLHGWYDVLDQRYKQQELVMKDGIVQSTFELFVDILTYIHEWQNYFVTHNRLYRIDNGCVQLLPVPLDFGYSFHLYTNRFLSSVISLGTAYSHHTATINKFIDTLRLPEFSSFTLPVLFDTTLLTMVFAAQIKEGMWRRNGFSMYEQLSHYSNSIISKTFRDLDLFLLQFVAAASAHTAESVDSLVAHILFRFTVDTRYYSQVFPYSFPLVGEFLSLITSLVTELPLPPSDFDHEKNEDYTKRLLPLLRRQIIHRLASGDASFSDLHESCHYVADYNSLKMECIDQLIKEVAEVRNTNETSKLHLKNEYWCEYDPGNMRVSNKIHQAILEKRPKIKEVTPMVVEPLPVHTSFHGVRNVLLSRSLFKVMRNMAFSYMCELHNTSKDHMPSSASLQQLLLYQSDFVKSVNDLSLENCNSAQFTEVLELLTLLVHHNKSVAANGEYIGYFLENVSVEIEVVCMSEQEAATTSTAPTSQPLCAPSMVPTTSTTNTLILPHMLCVLIDIFDCLKKNNEDNTSYWLLWVITSIGSMDQTCQTFINSRFASQLEEERKVEMEQKKKLARERAMAKIQKSAAVFSSFLADESDTESEQVKSNPNIEKIVCIICQDDGEDICMQAFCQRSTYIYKHSCKRQVASVDGVTTAQLCKIGDDYYYTDNPASICVDPVDDVSDNDTHISLCGHAMHYHCFDSYFATLLSRSEYNYDANLLDFSKGEFNCPICKRLNNILLPLPSPEVVKCAPTQSPHLDLLQYLRDVSGAVEGYSAYTDPYFSMVEYDINEYISSKVDVSTAVLSPLQQRYLQHLDSIHESTRPLRNDYITRRLHSLDSSDDPYPFYNLLLYAAYVIKATAFSLTVDEQKAPLFASPTTICEMPNIAEKRYMLRALSGCLEAFGLDALIAKYLLLAIENRGRLLVKDNSNSELDTDQQHYIMARITYFRHLWFLNNPLLAMPLYEVAVLSVILRDAEAEQGEGLFSSLHLAWIGVAKLVQLSVLGALQYHHGTYSATASTESLESLEQFQPVTYKTLALISLAASKVNPAYADLRKLPASLVLDTCNKWYVFLQSIANLRSIHFNEKQASQVTLVTLFDQFGYHQLFTTSGIHSSVATKVEAWVSDLLESAEWVQLQPMLLQCSRYPTDEYISRNVLLTLPHSYTEFHGVISSGVPYETPVVCLHCGLICDASGKGQCTKHADVCNATNSVFFLLDDCKLLFMYKGRAIYLHAPYIDEYGERHERERHYRAKPLYLDGNYYNSVQSLVAKHQVPREVYAKRSLSSRVIILGYY